MTGQHSDLAPSACLTDSLLVQFLVIAARPFTIPYLTALLPSELEIQQMEETDSSEQDEQTDTENIALHISTVGSPLPATLHPCPGISACLLEARTVGCVTSLHLERHILGSHTFSKC